MSDDFHLLDLPSQALAVQRLLSGQPESEKLAWIAVHGNLTVVPMPRTSGCTWYLFESALGLKCVFFIVGEQFVFIGDNTTYVVTR